MFDTHCHLNLDIFSGLVYETISEAREFGVEYFLVPGTNIADSKIASDISQSYDKVYSAVGIHPTEKLDENEIDAEIFKLEELITSTKTIVAIGEIGLDYFRFDSPSRVQKIYFERQLALACKYGLPVIIHNRMASEDVLLLLSKYSENKNLEGVLHCCEPEKELLDFANKHDFYVGINGDITYDRKKQGFIKSVNINKILVETDSPNLSPEPVRREKRFPNEPKNIRYIIEELSRIKNVDNSEIVNVTTANAIKLFGIK